MKAADNNGHPPLTLVTGEASTPVKTLEELKEVEQASRLHLTGCLDAYLQQSDLFLQRQTRSVMEQFEFLAKELREAVCWHELNVAAVAEAIAFPSEE
ncbi:MAG TPA: hypothetical protein VKU00_11570 [Chthonomonadaceae bacterium]|nr:hypothetical protein [Chthonomonadaceae bacterium]